MLLECVEDNVLAPLVREPTKECDPLDLLLVNGYRPVGDMMVGGDLGHRNHEMNF